MIIMKCVGGLGQWRMLEEQEMVNICASECRCKRQFIRKVSSFISTLLSPSTWLPVLTKQCGGINNAHLNYLGVFGMDIDALPPFDGIRSRLRQAIFESRRAAHSRYHRLDSQLCGREGGWTWNYCIGIRQDTSVWMDARASEGNECLSGIWIMRPICRDVGGSEIEGNSILWTHTLGWIDFTEIRLFQTHRNVTPMQWWFIGCLS